ncbi:HNH endonuclease [Lelliottia amnigena]
MSTQKFSSVEREAIWSAYNKKCAYTGQLIGINDFHIDHIVPENLAEKPDEYIKLKDRLGLSDDFDIYGYENLLPCRIATNLQKGRAEFDIGAAHYFLNLAKQKKVVVIEKIEQIQRRNGKAKALLITQQYVESGAISIKDLQSILNQTTNEDMYRLMVSLKISNEEEIEEIKQSEIEDLLDRVVYMGGNDHIDGLELNNDEDDEVIVRTSRDYIEAIKNNYYAKTTYAMKMATYFEWQCGLFSAISVAVLPSISFIENPKVGILDLDLLPFHLFPDLSRGVDDDVDMVETYQHHLDDGTLKVTQVKQSLLVVESSAMGQRLIEVVRADFTGEGYDSILCFEYTWATHGTFGNGGIRILTRKSANSIFEVVSL